MGVYFNPKNGSFTGDKNSRIYVDKTEDPEAYRQVQGS